MSYLKAVLKKDHNRKIKELKNLIRLGKKLNKITTPDEKKLQLLQDKEKKVILQKQVKHIIKPSKTSNTLQNLQNKIKNIRTTNNSIIITFDKNINKNIINFFELKQTPYFKDVFDIKARFEKIKTTHLKIKNINKISIGQFKYNTFRLVLTNKKNIKTYYTVSKNKITISINKEKKYIKKKIIEKTQNTFIDKKNLIRTIYTDDNTIRIKFNKNISRKTYKYTTYKTKYTYVDQFDIKGKYKYTNPLKLKINNLDRITVLNKNSNTTRIRIIHSKNLNIKYVQNKKELIIKIPTNNKTSIIKRVSKSRYKSKIIVIDAGHGAKDSGAVGPNKRYEKVVTLQVSKYLYKILKKRGHKVYLTRNKDKFIKVTHRTILANKKRADIFISIHANSVPKSKAHKVEGIETFFLSPARNARAKRVAAKENKSDIRNMSKSSKLVFLESLNRPRITASHKFAIDVQAGMLQSVRKRFSKVKDSGVREGPFWVLVGAQMPSILIELGYISHPKESRRLYNDEYQRLLAKGIATGVDSYFSKNP